MNRREELREQLVRTLERMGYPQEFGTAVAKNLEMEKNMGRMLG